MVLLRHTLPDGSWHFDWLFEAASGAPALQSFRVMVRIDAAEPPPAFDAVATPPHRPLYLTYEGPISGNRGNVTRVARGDVKVGPNGPGMAVALDWGNGVRQYVGKPIQDGVWRFILV
jgi:hypothetical protein